MINIQTLENLRTLFHNIHMQQDEPESILTPERVRRRRYVTCSITNNVMNALDAGIKQLKEEGFA